MTRQGAELALAIIHRVRSHIESNHSVQNGPEAPVAGYGRESKKRNYGREFLGEKLHGVERGTGAPEIEFFGSCAAGESEQQLNHESARSPASRCPILLAHGRRGKFHLRTEEGQRLMFHFFNLCRRLPRCSHLSRIDTDICSGNMRLS